MRTVYVTPYEHIDTFLYLMDPASTHEPKPGDHPTAFRLPCTEDEAKKAFKAAGWEGDLNYLWIPPFLVKYADTHGLLIWHVKQQNDGTSFLCSRQPFYFQAMEDHGRRTWWEKIEV